MSNYRRLISYIYAYEGGIKGKNVGFAKLEVRNGQCKIQVNVRNVYIGSQDTGVYLLSGSEEILVGRIFIRNGAGEFRAVVGVTNVAGSGHGIDQCYGLTVHNLSDSWQCYTTIWEDAVAHAAEVVLEGATSERVEKEEPVEGSVAKAVEAEIEAQSRMEEESQNQEEIPSLSSVIPPAKLTEREILRPADMGVMEIRPMEVLPIGKELKTADPDRENREEDREPEKENGESPTAAPEHLDGVESEPETFDGSADENADPKETGSMDAEPDAKREPETDGDIPKPENSDRQEQKRQLHMQSMPQSQPMRPNQWGQTGMLFPPNWFARPNRQNRSGQGRQMNDIRMGQAGFRMPPEIQEMDVSGQMQPGNGGFDPGWQAPAANEMETGMMPQPRQGAEQSQEEMILPPVQPQTDGQGEPQAASQEQSQAGSQGQPQTAGQSQPGAAAWRQRSSAAQNQLQPSSMQNQAQGIGQTWPSSSMQNQTPPLPSAQNQAQAVGQTSPQTAMHNQPQAAVENPQQDKGQNQPQAPGQTPPPSPMENQSRASDRDPQQAYGQNPSKAAGQGQTLSAVQNEASSNGQNRPAETIGPEANVLEDEPKIDHVWQRFYKIYPKIQAFDYNGGCEILTIKPQDIGLLPRETWGYGNNSFLLHGYYSHRYLIFARLNNPKGRPRYLLGVPGHYYSNEKYMAAMFGFPNFVLSKTQPTGDDRFGYWYTDIRLGS